jgi:peptidyl-prolyl cis-trans isomerase B (cyclophilin B)
MIVTPPRRARTLILLLTLIPWLAACQQESPAPATSTTTPTAAEPTPPAAPGPVEAIVHTNSGDFRFLLRPDVAPIACANFINLVQRGFYDGLEFYRHSRVIRQTGNPLNDENQRWDCGYRFMPEFSPDLRFDRGGMVALTRLVDDDASPVRPNEFFVTTKPQSERFTFKYPIFGVVVDGQDVVNAMPKGARIESIELVGDPAPLLGSYAEAIESWNQALDRMENARRTAP